MKNRWKTLLLTVFASAVLACTSVPASETVNETEITVQAEDAAAADQQLEAAKNASANMIGKLAEKTEEELNDLILTAAPSNKIIAANWMGVRSELGNVVEITEQNAYYSEDGRFITVESLVTYDKAPKKTKVTVTNVYDLKNSENTMEWNVDYPKSKLFGEAVLNTLMGIGIVFLVLLFLSFLIKNIHWIPDLVEKYSKGGAVSLPPVKRSAPAAAPAAPAAPAADDGALIAVITAAIAAARAEENQAGSGADTTMNAQQEENEADTFVVRSIRRLNRSSRF